jgi:hypothetical protein
MADSQDGQISISKNWLALTGTLVAIITGLASWGVSQTTARSTQALQIETLERRLDGADARSEQRRTGLDQTWRNYDERLSALSDRLARIEARLDAAAALSGPRSRTGFECAPPGSRADQSLLREVAK